MGWRLDGVQIGWRWCIWICCWFFFFKLKTLQKKLRVFCRELRDALVWLLQPAYWLSCIKKWVIIFSKRRSQWLSHSTTIWQWAALGSSQEMYWHITGLDSGTLGCTRGLHLIYLGKSADTFTHKILENITLHIGKHTGTIVCSQLSSLRVAILHHGGWVCVWAHSYQTRLGATSVRKPF